MALFTGEQREQLRAELVSMAQNDARLTGAAHIGSAARGVVDRWSDIDLNGTRFIHSGELRQVGRPWRGGRATGRQGVR